MRRGGDDGGGSRDLSSTDRSQRSVFGPSWPFSSSLSSVHQRDVGGPFEWGTSRTSPRRRSSRRCSGRSATSSTSASSTTGTRVPIPFPPSPAPYNDQLPLEGKAKGYGFCEYADAETAASAIRNLNGIELHGRALRVDSAAGAERNKEEVRQLQMTLGAAQAGLLWPPRLLLIPPDSQFLQEESPYGPATEPGKAPEAISRAVASLPPEQMFELMKQMKVCAINAALAMRWVSRDIGNLQLCIQNNPNEARNMLLQNPQLAYALLQAQVFQPSSISRPLTSGAGPTGGDADRGAADGDGDAPCAARVHARARPPAPGHRRRPVLQRRPARPRPRRPAHAPAGAPGGRPPGLGALRRPPAPGRGLPRRRRGRRRLPGGPDLCTRCPRRLFQR